MVHEYIYPDQLQSKRLSTRFVTKEDILPWVAFFEDTEGTKFLHVGSGLQPKERAEEWINATMRRYSEKAYGLQALIEKKSGKFIGICGLLLQNINDTKEIEVGYHLLKEYRGKGYASEAAQMFRDYAFENGITESVISIINPENWPSKNVAARNGMRLSADNVPFRGHLYDVYRIEKDEWKIQRGPAK